MPKLGERVQFTPSALIKGASFGDHWGDIPGIVTGKIVYINFRHRFYNVEYQCGRSVLREAFKF